MQRPDEGTITVDGSEVALHVARPTPSRSASAWCTSTSCWPTTSRSSRTSSSAPSRRTGGVHRLRQGPAHASGSWPTLRPRRRPRRARRDARRRRAPAGRDPQGALPGRPHPDPRRADRGARAPGGRRRSSATSRELKAEGVTIIFISHKLDEVLAIADTITVIRGRAHGRHGRADGRRRAAELAELMVGSELPDARDTRSPPSPTTSCSRSRTSRVQRGRPAGASTTSASRSTGARSSGIAGVEGNGQSELIEAIIGHAARSPPARSRSAARTSPQLGTRRPARERASATSPRTATATGLAARCAAVGERSARPPDPARRSHAAPGSTGRRARTRPSEIVDGVRRAHPGIDVAAQALSGGNQQKLIVGREMIGRPHRAHRRPPHPGHRRRRPGRHLGPAAGRPAPPAWRSLLIVRPTSTS